MQGTRRLLRVLSALTLGLVGVAGFSGCGGSSGDSSSPSSDAATDVLADVASDASDGAIDCSRVGCAAPPMCDPGCTAACGCCGCADGEKTPIEGGFLVCTGGCYVVESASDGG